MTPPELTYRPFTDDELPQAHALLGLVFGESFDAADLADERLVQEPGRSQAAFDGDTLVGSMSTYSLDLSVPGGLVPCAGLTWVAVAPTHRRRGVLSTMMSRHLAEVTEPVAALWASEAAIYGRYGYGMAAEQQTVSLVAGDGLAWAPTAPGPADSIRLVSIEDAATTLPPIHDACRRRRGGMPSRSADWWRFQVLSERPATRGGGARKVIAVATIDGHDAAYAVYSLAEGWETGALPAGTVQVVEMMGVDAAAEAAMWRFLAGHDLMTSVKAFRRPVDDPLPLLLANSRHAVRSTLDSLHVRVMDVAAAFTTRAYSDSVGLTIAVTDAHRSANEGTWRLEVAPEGAVVQATDDDPDLSMDIADMGSLYLGGISVSRLAAAGRVTVHNPTVVAGLDSALRPAEAPWTPEIW